MALPSAFMTYRSLFEMRAIFPPSGDQLGPKQPIVVGSEIRPPHPGIGICRSPVPSEWTDQTVLRWSLGAWAENRISFPCGDQFPQSKLMENWSLPSGVICRSPLPSSLVVNSANVVSFCRRKTRRLPFGE